MSDNKPLIDPDELGGSVDKINDLNIESGSFADPLYMQGIGKGLEDNITTAAFIRGMQDTLSRTRKLYGFIIFVLLCIIAIQAYLLLQDTESETINTVSKNQNNLNTNDLNIRNTISSLIPRITTLSLQHNANVTTEAIISDPISIQQRKALFIYENIKEKRDDLNNYTSSTFLEEYDNLSPDLISSYNTTLYQAIKHNLSHRYYYTPKEHIEYVETVAKNKKESKEYIKKEIEQAKQNNINRLEELENELISTNKVIAIIKRRIKYHQQNPEKTKLLIFPRGTDSQKMNYMRNDLVQKKKKKSELEREINDLKNQIDN